MLAGDQLRILVLFIIAAVSDGLDGYLAKRFNWTSELGRVLDPLADKVLLIAVFITAAWLDIAPWWLAAVAIARDLVIGFGALIYRDVVRAAARPAHHHQQVQYRRCSWGTCWR